MKTDKVIKEVRASDHQHGQRDGHEADEDQTSLLHFLGQNVDEGSGASVQDGRDAVREAYYCLAVAEIVQMEG